MWGRLSEYIHDKNHAAHPKEIRNYNGNMAISVAMADFIIPETSFKKGLWLLENAMDYDAESSNYLKRYLEKLSHYKPIDYIGGLPVYSLYQPVLGTPAGNRSLAFRLQRRMNSLRVPATATIAINKACQCACAHCSAVHNNHSKELAMSTQEIIQAISETIDLGVTMIILLGGEPLLHRDLPAIIESVDKTRAAVIMFTNGEYLDEKKCEQLKRAGLMGSFVSIDSDVAREHNAFRKRPGLFDKAVQGMKYLRDAGLVAGISTHISHSRLANNYFERMMDLARATEAHEITFFDAIPTGRWIGEEKDLLTSIDRIKIKELVAGYRKRDYPGIAAQSTMTSECGSSFCFAANTQFYLSAMGDMCPCDFTPLSFGRFPEYPIRTLWEKMTATEPYNKRAKSCRMQDAAFRKKYLQNANASSHASSGST